MEEKLILNQAIIDKVRSKSGKGPKGFTIPQLRDDLLKFIEENKELVDSYIRDEFDAKGFADLKRLRLALTQDTKDSGAMPGLRDLLCYYAFGKKYSRTLTEDLHTTIEDEIAYHEKIRGSKQSVDERMQIGFDSIKSDIGSMGEHIDRRFDLLSEVLEYNQRKGKEAAVMSKAFDDYLQAVKQNDKKTVHTSLKEITSILSARIDEEIKVQSYFTSELLMGMMAKGEHEAAIEVSKRISLLCPNDLLLNFFVAQAYLGCNRHKEALEYINRNLSIEPGEAENLLFRIHCNFEMSEYEIALQLTDEALRLYHDGKMYRILTHLTLTSFTKSNERITVDKSVLTRLLRLRVVALMETNAGRGIILNAINDFLRIEEDIVFMKSKLRLLNNRPFEFLEYCESCAKKFPQEPFFMLHLIAAQTQSNMKSGKILRNVTKLAAIGNEDALHQLKTDKVFQRLWEHPDFQKAINGEGGSSSWKFWR